MITIILIVCHLSAPFDCKDVPLQPVGMAPGGAPMPMSYFDCTLHGQEIAQDWLDQHPNWLLHKWRCEQSRRGEKPA